MKTAICISGIPRGKAKSNIDLMKKKFGTSDVFFLTWKGQEEAFKKLLPEEKFYTHKEPVMHYHPLADVDESVMPPVFKTWKLREACSTDLKLRENMSHYTKQIHAHAYLLQQVPEEFDMIIRSRFDTLISDKVDFFPLIERSYVNNIAIGFGTRVRRHDNLDVLAEVPKIWPDRYEPTPGVSNDWGGYIMDPVIMHPRKLFDAELVQKLHKDKKLLPAERGWYQILSQPHGDTHECYYGGAQVEKYVGITSRN